MFPLEFAIEYLQFSLRDFLRYYCALRKLFRQRWHNLLKVAEISRSCEMFCSPRLLVEENLGHWDSKHGSQSLRLHYLATSSNCLHDPIIRGECEI